LRTRGDFEKEIIQKIKFGNAPYLSNFFRIGLRKAIKAYQNKNYKGIVITPSNKSTIRKRPISVCKPIIELLSKELRLSVISPLRKKSKELQSGKSFRDRFLHAQLAFEVAQPFIKKLNGNYLLVDDVFTTGATINEITKLLLVNGAEEVDVLVLVKGRI
jgi:competence protein ComFC